MDNGVLINILWGIVGGLTGIILLLLGWFLNKVWERQDEHEERLAQVEAAMGTLAKVFEKQEEFQERVLARLLDKGI